MQALAKSLLDKVDSYYEQAPAERSATLRLVLEAANKNQTAFIELLHQEKFDGLNNLPIFYEALATDLENWADFFLDEARRLLQLARVSPQPKMVLTHFDEFTFIDYARFRHRRALLELLDSELQNPNPVFRFSLMETIEELATASDTRVVRLLAQLADDSNWRVRHRLYMLTLDSQVLREPMQLGWLDRLRARFLNPHAIA